MRFLPDVEVIFQFNGSRVHPIYDGFRPMHLIMDNYLTSGIHHYYDRVCIAPDASVSGTISFRTPEAYPHSCWPGKKILIQEGEKIIGFAIVSAVLNPLLSGDK